MVMNPMVRSNKNNLKQIQNTKNEDFTFRLLKRNPPFMRLFLNWLENPPCSQHFTWTKKGSSHPTTLDYYSWWKNPEPWTIWNPSAQKNWKILRISLGFARFLFINWLVLQPLTNCPHVNWIPKKWSSLAQFARHYKHHPVNSSFIVFHQVLFHHGLNGRIC